MESTRSTRSFQQQNPEILGESECEIESSIVSAPSYSMITDDNSDSLLADEQSDATATEQGTEVIESTVSLEEETTISLEEETIVVRDVARIHLVMQYFRAPAVVHLQ